MSGGTGRARVLAALVAGLALVAVTVACDPRPPEAGDVTGPWPVVEVIDGDTVALRLDGRRRSVRLIGIDTPEVNHPVRGAEPFGRQATDFARTLLPVGRPVLLEYDAEREDDYGRLLAYLYVTDPDGAWQVDGAPATQVNLRIAEAGWARALRVPPNGRHAARIEAAVDAARAAGLGMWGGPDAAASGADVALACALIDPAADLDRGEWVSVRLARPLDTTGYAVWDQGSGVRLPLPGGTRPAGELRVTHRDQGILNNGGDTIRLLRGETVVDAWPYRGDQVREGQPLCR